MIDDDGRKEADAVLASVQKEIGEVYSEATKEVQKKLDTYMKRYGTIREKKLKELQDGKITQDDFDKWQRGWVKGDWYKEMLDVLSTDLTNADRLAMSAVNGYMPDVYAVGMNYGTYQVESGTTFNTSFTLYNREAVERLIRDNPKLLPIPNEKVNIPKDKAWNQKHLNRQITQGILQGESIPKIARRLEKVVGMDKNAAIRNARTATTGAENAGRFDSYKRAQAMGIVIKKQWLATPDGRTRDSHVELDLEVVELGENFSNGCEYPGDPGGDPAEVYNCFIPSTSVAIDSDIVRSYKHYYSGEVISIESACGVKFTCTPNHPILTTRGWVKANLLNEGNNIIVTSVSNESLARRNPNINHVFSRFDAVHKALNKFGAKRTCALSVNFHGDIPTTEVEIITKKRFLRNHRNPRVFKAVDKFFLKSANKAALFFGTFLKHFGSIGKSSLGDVGGRCKAFPFFRRSVRHTNKHGFRSIANSDVVLSEYSINDLPTDVEFAGESLDRLAGNVFADKIVSVNVGVFNGHVYNLQTKNNYYFVNDIIPQSREKSNGIFAVAHNCRCAMIPWLDRLGDKFDGERAMNLHGMTYDEWKESHSRKVNVPVQQKVSDILRDAYENHREINNLNLSPANDFWGRMSLSGADLTGIDDALKKSIEESLDDLTRRFDTPLIRVETMDAQESLMRQKTFASVHHNYEVDSATMKLNSVRFRDRDAFVERLKELRQSGYIPAVSDDKIDSYVVTHEFAHSLLGMQDPLSNARNFANADYGKIRSARKEIESIWQEYATSVGTIDEERKKMESAAIFGDVEAWEKAKTLTEELRRVQISRYSLTNSDEFLAESFVAVELGDTENEFAIRAHSVMVKYFGR